MSALRHKIHQINSFLKHFILAKRKGHGVHSPFVYGLCEEVFYNEHLFYDFELLQDLRAEISKDKTLLEINDLGAGSMYMNKNRRRVKDILSRGTSPQRQSELIYLLINYLKSKTSVELGTSIGINSLYMSSANKNGMVYTIDGSEALFQYAKKLGLKTKCSNVAYICGNFDQAFPELLKRVDHVDFIYFDGNHSLKATIRYFEMALKNKTPNTVFMFDDIYWNKEMTEAWLEIKKHPDVSLTIDTFYFGLVFFRQEMREKQDVKLFL